MRRRRTRVFTSAFAAAVVASGMGASPFEREEAALLRRVEAIRHPATMRKWEQIPWLTDLNAGIECARRERRPIFLWVAGDDPLERC